jgi:hypothetical protein
MHGGQMSATITQQDVGTLADAIANALHKHIPDWPGAFEEQLVAIARDVLLAAHPDADAQDSEQLGWLAHAKPPRSDTASAA